MNTIIDEELKKTINEIKNDIKNTQIKTMLNANKELIMLYFRIGKVLEEKSKYGNSFIKKLSFEVKQEYPNIDGFGERNLRSMKLFYNEYKEVLNWQQLVANLPWGHNILLIEKIKDINIRKIYMEACIKNGWSRNVLDLQIKSNYHKRIGNSTNNFKISLPKDSDVVNNIIKDPYIFDFLSLKENYKEKELETAMINRIKDVILELGKEFCFVGNQYKISVDNVDYYIDLLFYHLELRCFVVLELKVTLFKPEYIGQLNFYINVINDTLKKESDNNTIGLLLCKNRNNKQAYWSLKGINNPIGISSYEIDKYIPKDAIENILIDEFK